MKVELTKKEMWSIECYIEAGYNNEKDFLGPRPELMRIIQKMKKGFAAARRQERLKRKQRALR